MSLLCNGSQFISEKKQSTYNGLQVPKPVLSQRLLEMQFLDPTLEPVNQNL